MKISISKSLVQALSSISATVAGATLVTGKEVEELLGASKKDSDVTPKMPNIPGFHLVKEFTNKIVKVSKNEAEVTIELNDDYIIDVAELGAKMFRKSLPLVVEQMKVAQSFVGDLEHFANKWKKQDVVVDSEKTEDTIQDPVKE